MTKNTQKINVVHIDACMTTGTVMIAVQGSPCSPREGLVTNVRFDNDVYFTSWRGCSNCMRLKNTHLHSLKQCEPMALTTTVLSKPRILTRSPGGELSDM
jgi:hypothetical protein